MFPTYAAFAFLFISLIIALWGFLWELFLQLKLSLGFASYCTSSVWGLAQTGKNGFEEKKDVGGKYRLCIAVEFSFGVLQSLLLSDLMLNSAWGSAAHIFQADITWREPSSLLSVEGSWGIASAACFSSGLRDAPMHLGSTDCSVILSLQSLPAGGGSTLVTHVGVPVV